MFCHIFGRLFDMLSQPGRGEMTKKSTISATLRRRLFIVKIAFQNHTTIKPRVKVVFYVQLDWPWIAEWACARWHFCCGCLISKPRPVLDFLSKNQGSFFFLFKKSKNELARPKTVFLAILAKIRSFSDNSNIIANLQYTSA